MNAAQKLEVGSHVRSDLQGLGFATEAATACRDYAREHIEATELIAIIHPDNRASERVAEKIGMHRVADDRGGKISPQHAAVDTSQSVRWRIPERAVERPLATRFPHTLGKRQGGTWAGKAIPEVKS